MHARSSHSKDVAMLRNVAKIKSDNWRLRSIVVKVGSPVFKSEYTAATTSSPRGSPGHAANIAGHVERGLRGNVATGPFDSWQQIAPFFAGLARHNSPKSYAESTRA